jgi:hypothetical protein
MELPACLAIEQASSSADNKHKQVSAFTLLQQIDDILFAEGLPGVLRLFLRR